MTKSIEVKAKKPEQHHDGFFKTLIIAVVCAAIIRSFLYEPFHIPSSSMKANLLIGDYIFVSKFSYGYSKYSFPFSPNLFSGRIFSSQPKRGDVVVFRLPSSPDVNYIKRLIGLPGDKIQVINGQVFINEEAVAKEYLDDFIDEDGSKTKRFSEILPEGKRIEVLDQTETPQDNTGIYIVPEGHYFMMGDNRDNSQDSRFLKAVGYVPEENLVGKANIIFFSDAKPFWQFWNWNEIRWRRIFRVIR
ncbi:MAG: lepB1 [Rickettsiaceae bacterium]|jgi:signal peptidase I|nr:lepB1 [Rickettsiaceae bacterium]